MLSYIIYLEECDDAKVIYIIVRKQQIQQK